MKAWKVLGWEPKTDFNALVHRLCYHDLLLAQKEFIHS